jgi:phosphatidylserine/phosphatidylglycerophosphate/cardiolipin synthase-like enzyme
MTGGRNIGHLYFAPSVDSPDVFRDTDILFRSKKVSDDLRVGFTSELTSPFNKKVHGEYIGLNIRRDIELTAAYIMMDEWLKGTPCTDDETEQLLTNEDKREQAAETLRLAVVKRLPELGFDRKANKWDTSNFMPWAMQLVALPHLKGAGLFDPESMFQSVECAKIIDKGSAQNDIEDQIQGALVKLAGAATKSIVIQNPYVVLTKMAVKAFADAGKRGVKITIVTNSPVSSDSKETQGFFLDKWPLYQAAIPNLKFLVLAGARKLHAKTAVFDDVVSLIGTYNLDYMSARVNSEILSVTWSEGFAGQLTESILNDPSYASDLFEYRIKMNDDGSPVDSDPSTPGIEPIVEQGAEDHVPQEIMDEYVKIRKKTRLMGKLPQLNSLY